MRNTKHVATDGGAAVWSFLEALPVNNGWPGFVVLLLGDPHLLEGGEGGQNRSSNPDRVLPEETTMFCGRTEEKVANFWFENTSNIGGLRWADVMFDFWTHDCLTRPGSKDNLVNDHEPFRRGNYLDLHGGGGEGGHLLLHPISNAWNTVAFVAKRIEVG